MKVVYIKRIFFPSQTMDGNFQIEYHVIEDYNLKTWFCSTIYDSKNLYIGLHFHICTHIIAQIPIVKHFASLKMCCIASYPSHKSTCNNTAPWTEMLLFHLEVRVTWRSCWKCSQEKERGPVIGSFKFQISCSEYLHGPSQSQNSIAKQP